MKEALVQIKEALVQNSQYDRSLILRRGCLHQVLEVLQESLQPADFRSCVTAVPCGGIAAVYSC